MATRKPLTELPERATVFVPFQLCKLVPAPPEGERWLHEIKFDGYRIQVRVDGGLARSHTRNGLDFPVPPWPPAVFQTAHSTASCAR